MRIVRANCRDDDLFGELNTDVTARAEIATSLATAWHWAAEPYAPLRHIPGITWTPVEVVVEHRPTRSQQGR